MELLFHVGMGIGSKRGRRAYVNCVILFFFFFIDLSSKLTNFREVVFFIIDSGFFFFLSWSWIFLHRNPLYEFSWHSRFSPVNNLVDKFLFRLSKR